MTIIASPNTEWLGHLPTSWSMTTVRALVEDINIRNFGGKNENYLSLMANIGVILYADKGDVGNKKPEDLSKCKIVKIGDLVINSMNYGIGSYGISRYEGICSPVYLVLRTKSDVGDQNFVRRIFEIPQFQRLAQSFGNGILEHRRAIGWDSIKNLPVPMPPLDTQQKIAAFLDRETAQIDELIGKQERLIELLAEKRQAIITHAVTKGLNSNAPTRPSGIPWLGEIPAHWTLGRIKDSVARATNGLWGSEPGESEVDVWCVRVADFDRTNQSVTREKMTYRGIAQEEVKRKHLRRGDLLLEKSGGGEKSPVGFVARFDHADLAICSNFVAVVRLAPEMDSRFWQYVHSSNYSTKLTERSIKQSTGIQNLDQSSYFNEIAAIPPLNEQISIAKYLARKLTIIDETSTASVRAISVLRERRSALISAAVTGKIDVREGVA